MEELGFFNEREAECFEREDTLVRPHLCAERSLKTLCM